MHDVHRVTARNTASASENKIHDDAVARRFGFAGGLVPGVTTWAYLCHPPAATLGRAWVERGTMAARFVKPIYEGELLEIGAADIGGTGFELTATNPDGEVCAVGTAGLPPKAAQAPALEDFPTAPFPARESRPPASTDSLAPGTVLGTMEFGFHSDRASDYLDQVSDQLPLWRDEGIAHPGWLVQHANFALSGNVALGPWVHISTQAHHLGAVADGERLAIRTQVAALRERNGNQIVDLDMLYVADESRPVLRLRHSAIWQLAEKS